MSSNVPPAAPKRRHGRMQKMDSKRKAERMAKREKRRGTEADWRGRVWVRKHVKG